MYENHAHWLYFFFRELQERARVYFDDDVEMIG